MSRLIPHSTSCTRGCTRGCTRSCTVLNLIAKTLPVNRAKSRNKGNDLLAYPANNLTADRHPQSRSASAQNPEPFSGPFTLLPHPQEPNYRSPNHSAGLQLPDRKGGTYEPYLG